MSSLLFCELQFWCLFPIFYEAVKLVNQIKHWKFYKQDFQSLTIFCSIYLVKGTKLRAQDKIVSDSLIKK